jgi:lipopolysaccharide assembly outer membrane protein LptD (OstA)
MERKKKLRIIQLSLLIFGFILIFFTYLNNEHDTKDKIISKEIKKKIKEQLNDQEGDVFYNIEYSGLDLAGNRYILKSKEAVSDKVAQEIINMKSLEAVFYFKDGKILKVWSDLGLYNNKTLDMVFEKNVKAIYEGSDLFAKKAVYSNSESFLTISGKVKVVNISGTMFADELFFDIKKQELNIASYNDNKVNANINLK